MPELRRDPVTERWVVLAPERALRPQAFADAPRSSDQPANSTITHDESICPFCPGNEHLCPEPLLAFQAPSPTPLGDFHPNVQPADDKHVTPWSVRVVRNLYPALMLDGTRPCDISRLATDDGTGMFQRRAAIGSHEVVIESARHATRMHQLETWEISQVLAAYVERFQAWRAIDGLRCGIAFRNNGRQAGASLEHVHSQLVGLHHAPPRLELEWTTTRTWFERTGRCLFCEMLQREQQEACRIVAMSDSAALICPYASRAPYEMWLIPTRHASDFDHTSVGERHAIASALGQAIGRLEQLLPGVGWNYVLHTGPFDIIAKEHYHWHIEIIPRIAQLAGYEWGTDQYINLVTPEQAAKQLQLVSI